ncbi:copper chaperone [Paenibacillaceae bacterium]|nr:copper chaperone [Paenibacillaceae bacterium]
MKTEILEVRGMSCGHCVASVEKALKSVGAAGSVDLAAGKVEVQYNDEAVTIAAVKEAIEEQGYDVV